MEIFLAKTQGFCAGVASAIDIVELALKTYGTPLYVYHDIVHNTSVVEDMKRNMPGLVFISPSINWGMFKGVSFDYLKFFSQSKEFREIWKNYKYSSSVGEISIYKNINEPVTHRGLT